MPLMLRFDRVMIWTIIFLVVLGLIMVYSTTAASGTVGSVYIIKQGITAGLGFLAMYALMFVEREKLRRREVVFGILALSASLLVTAALLGEGANTKRFLRTGLLSFQPSELAKPAIILYLAYFLQRNSGSIRNLRVIARPLAVVGAMCGLILLGRDFGTAATLLILASVMLFMAGVPLRWFALGALAVAPLAYFAVWQVPYRRSRIFAFLEPEADPLGAGFQILQSQIAVGSGGIFGNGWMAGKQKMLFLPEAHTDFIYSVVGEELGLVGSLLVLAAFAVLIWRGIRSACLAGDRFSFHLAAGVTAMIGTQAMLNMGVVLGLLPTKGMPLPFISYGGSSLIVLLASCGVLLSVGRSGKA